MIILIVLLCDATLKIRMITVNLAENSLYIRTNEEKKAKSFFFLLTQIEEREKNREKYKSDKRMKKKTNMKGHNSVIGIENEMIILEKD